MKTLIFGNTHRKEIIPMLRSVYEALLAHDVQIAMDEEFYRFICSNINTKPQVNSIIRNDDFDGDIAFSIGGDGTFLNTAARVGTKEIPILGINTGRLGFLAEYSCDDIANQIEQIVHNRFLIEERTLLEAINSDRMPIAHPFALNEVAVLKQDLSSMISIKTTVNGEHLHTYEADGLIIATPTGSTAYSMSVGGPLLVPEAENFIIAPVASHSLNVRPLIIPDDWEIELEIKSRSKSYLISIDGRSMLMPHSNKITIHKANHSVKIARPQENTYFKTLKNKLMWGIDKRN